MHDIICCRVLDIASLRMERERAARPAALKEIASRPLLDSGAAASAGYVEKVARRVRANVFAPFDIKGNPAAVIAVTCPQRGAAQCHAQASERNPQCDRAVVVAVGNSDPMPVDVNGSAPTSFVMTFRPNG